MSSSDFGAGQPRLHAVAASEVTRIRITDSDFQPVLLPENAGQVDVALAPGIYEVAFVDAEVTERQLVVLRSGAGTPVEVTQSPHVVGTPGPTSGGGATSLAVDEPDPGAPGGLSWQTGPTSPGDLIVVVHDGPVEGLCPASVTPAGPHGLAEGLSLVSADGTSVSEGSVLPERAPDKSALHFSVPSGLWRLRLHTGLADQVLETPVVACLGRATTVHLPAVPYSSAGNRRADLARTQLRRFQPGPRSEELDHRSRRLEANALQALAEGLQLRGERFDGMLRGLLNAEFDYPMLGIYAGYLLAARVADPKHVEDLGLLANVVNHFDRVTRYGPDKNLEPPPSFRRPDDTEPEPLAQAGLPTRMTANGDPLSISWFVRRRVASS